MKILLKKVDFTIKGIYATKNGELPDRMKFIHSDVYNDLKKLQEDTKFELVYSDLFRTCAESLYARRQKGKMVAMPGFSGHNYGISFDLDVEKALKLLDDGKTKKRNAKILNLYKFMEKYGFKPMQSVIDKFNKGALSASEEWHFNHLMNFNTVEEWIDKHHSEDFDLDTKELQTALHFLGYKCWPIDGDFGKITRSAMNKFQKDYSIEITELPDYKTKRYLAVFTSEIQYV